MVSAKFREAKWFLDRREVLGWERRGFGQIGMLNDWNDALKPNFGRPNNLATTQVLIQEGCLEARAILGWEWRILGQKAIPWWLRWCFENRLFEQQTILSRLRFQLSWDYLQDDASIREWRFETRTRFGDESDTWTREEKLGSKSDAWWWKWCLIRKAKFWRANDLAKAQDSTSFRLTYQDRWSERKGER